ncbi:hypothetical protein [Rodentibacter trehalosifermentans]|uniref:Uncharacterized protein n=1 Tax=Rodentibacter trehalosifermentans TaxID=1908263 RepID=A0A1V3IVK2_9PAST|nr:hypothetical protein [Rodentibacter trehalosifermentans]OOF46309.1 hypothetical protein BKK52_11665 [Rodentibacter trehalosifermentans]OOF52596.1 hypothetical protein BKK53_04590 [Rodentibacter trehalosifermentans]
MKNKLLITDNIFSYSYFVNEMEINYGYLDSWLNMEILNALALDEWIESGQPVNWRSWKEKYQEEAIKLVENFFQDIY